MEKQAKIYIAGHRGLVGSAIWRNLEAAGYTNLVGRTSAELDLRDQRAVEAFFAAERPEFVFLSAAKVGGILANNLYRAEFIYDNLMIQSNVIHQSWRHGVKRLLFLGSTCIYPRDCPQPMREEYLLTGPLEQTNEPYAIAKIAGMKMCESYNRQYGTDFISVMPTNLYGPHDNFDLKSSHVLPAMLRKIHLGKLLENNDYEAIANDLKSLATDTSNAGLTTTLATFGVTRHASRVTISLWGTGTPLREFLWSDDMADACIHLLSLPSAAASSPLLNKEGAGGGPGAGGGGAGGAVIPAKAGTATPTSHAEGTPSPFLNLGTGLELSISSLAALIKRVVGFTGDIVFDPSKPDGTPRKLTDVTRLHASGWHHKIELEEGVALLYKWYLNNIS